MKTKILINLFTLIALSKAVAMPVVSETAGTIKYGNTTLYKDSENPHKVYFFPNSTAFSKDADDIPLFNFVYWGLSENSRSKEAGAYMTMATRLANSSDQQKALDQYKIDHPEAEISVLPLKSSYYELKSTADGSPLKDLFKEFNYASHGGRPGDEIGLNAVLTEIGARAFKKMLSKSTTGQVLKFDYCYIYEGYGPNMKAEVSVEMRRVYDYFQGSHSGGWGWFSWDIRRITEELVQNNTIKIKMLGGNATDWEMINAVAATLTKRLFTPELAASPVASGGGQNLFRFGASSVHKEELKKEVWTWDRQDIVEREFCTAISIKDLAPYLDKLVSDADAD